MEYLRVFGRDFVLQVWLVNFILGLDLNLALAVDQLFVDVKRADDEERSFWGECHCAGNVYGLASIYFSLGRRERGKVWACLRMYLDRKGGFSESQSP